MEPGFGVPSFVTSHKRSSRPVIQYRSKRWESAVLEFSYKSAHPKDPSTVYYRCIACYRLSQQVGPTERCPVAHLTLRNGVLATDPDRPSTSHSCNPPGDSNASTVLSKRFMYEVRTNVRSSRKRPREAFDEAVSSIPERFADYDDTVRGGIQAQLNSGYGFSTKRRCLSRNRHHAALKGNTLDAILPELRVTTDSQVFLQLEDKTQGRRTLVFYAEKDLDALVGAEQVLGDGNYKYNPPEFHCPGQLYTLHTFIKGEAHLVLYPLMLACDVQAYEVEFRCLQASMEGRFGHIGTLSTTATWVFDYESAALQAAINVFRTSSGQPQIRGCAFHFAKAINARRDELGLKTLCRDNPAVHAWFTRVRHLPFVPDAFRLEFASDLLSDKPSLQPLNAARLDQFERYFRGFWLTNSLLKDIWGQFGDRGARTTNNVEGWHNGLHSRLPSRHPDLAEFLQFLKSAQHAAQNRIQALLLDPLAVAQPQSHVIQTRNNKLHQEMDAFASFINSHAPTFVDVRNYIDRVASSGALPVSH
ncbi:hypothetical protein HPB47_016202 [Ixodes persulcatus]|uniref:Uncharacterized protein n=1 Tax=Ixodes persulcatus TaxID=34615 RepID=A0AC60QV55_IXOPE|nr:hypothetical protein HPB47_016202 [Ixodes persulcatus]